MSSKLKLTIIGPGVVGTTIAVLAARTCHYEIIIGARDEQKGLDAAKLIDGDVVVCGISEAASLGDIVLLTVSDDVIGPLCTDLAHQRVFRSGAVVAHCSGALTRDELMSAKTCCGSSLASMHPLQTFPNLHTSIARIQGTFCYYESDFDAKDVICNLATDIGMQVVELKKEAKSLYHASAVMACNYLATLMDSALALAEAAGIDRTTMWQSLDPLVMATLHNVRQLGAEHALTGPIVRGDVRTVKNHLAAINTIASNNVSPNTISSNSVSSNTHSLHSVYASMGSQTVKLARKRGAIDPDIEEQFNDMFDASRN